MNSLLLEALPALLAAAFIIVGILIGVCSIFALIARIILVVKYKKLNDLKNKSGYTSYAAARALLDGSGMADVQVQQAGFWRGFIFGNHYNRKQNTIYLRKNIADKDTVMAIAIALQKVGIVIQDKQGDKKTILRNKMQSLVVFAPVLFLPIVIIGTLLDFTVMGGTGTACIASIVLGVVFYGLGFVFTLLNIPVENRANKKALEIMEQTNFCDAEEREKIADAFKAYMLSYILEFVLALLKLIQALLKIVIKIVASRN